MKPKTAQEMTQLLVSAMMSRLYIDLTAAARRGKMIEHDIGTIERRVIAELENAEDFSQEFDAFESEPAVDKALQMFREFMAISKAARIEMINKP